MSEPSIEHLSPFELSLYLEKKITANADRTILNAGRGNPNWTAPTPREAFFLLGQFAVAETLNEEGVLTADQITDKTGRTARFRAFLTAHPGPGADFLARLPDLDETLLGMPFEPWLTAMCDGIIGDNYPAPVRCLEPVETPLSTYLDRELFGGRQLDFDVFPVEGGTAGICYLFDTLHHTELLQQGDRIALFLPTFAPYLEIPELPTYNFDVVKIQAQRVESGDRTTYTYPQGELDKLRDPRIKAAFLVNPSNPTANAMSPQNLKQLQQIVTTARPDLLIITDDVYGTFVPQFLSLFAAIPKNVACLYSFSKYFGATGWRVGAIAVARDNAFDVQIARLPAQARAAVDARYAPLNPDQSQLTFIDRLVADSRDVALNHAAGLSTASQVMIALFSLYGILDDGVAYKKEVMALVREREAKLFATLGLDQPLAALDTAYYADIDLAKWVASRYGADFAKALMRDWTPTKLLVALAEEEQVMLLKTSPFGSDPWAVRVSLANLPTNQYTEVANRLIHLVDRLHAEWQEKAGDS